MDIINAVNAGVYRPVRSAAVRTTKTGTDSFAERVKSGGTGSGSHRFTERICPAIQLKRAYNKWKETQLPQDDLPNSQGPTEENMTYLRNRYSGDLTMFRKMEALDTMFDMGIITREQRNFFYGVEERIWSARDLGMRSGPLDESFGSKFAQDEQKLYRLSPLAKSATLDDLFSWLEDT